ncbi:DUF6491 family protein [Luteimonas lutimaris]|uniref:DUF6491 family protein n=1 Tax=Luteimonas lutimaris TaxID=698645 RepID=A0ABP7MS89_9GAMM|nr:DUF6491 family protein [Luteimonas sp.]
MKTFTAVPSLLLALLAAACASTGMTQEQKLDTYRAHAGAPVSSFRYFGQINGWTSLGERNIAVWTKPSEAWLLELSGPCPDIDYAPAITVTNQFNRVSAKFDKIIVHGAGTPRVPCRIETIRPLDVKAIKQAEKTARDQVDEGQAEEESSGT